MIKGTVYFTYDVIHVSMGDEEEVVGDGTLRASSNVECYLERGEHYARLLASNGEPLHLIPFNLHALLLLLLLLLSSPFTGITVALASRTHICHGQLLWKLGIALDGLHHPALYITLGAVASKHKG